MITITYKISLNKGAPRVWIENAAALIAAGFTPGAMYSVELKPGRIVLSLDPAGARKVTPVANGKGVIDLRSLAMFGFIKDRRAELEAGQLRCEARFTPGRIVVALL